LQLLIFTVYLIFCLYCILFNIIWCNW